MTLRVASYGGGVQSTALLVLAAQGRVDFPVMVFANVGDQAENPETLDYFAKHALPYAEKHGIELVERRWVDRTGRTRDLYEDLHRQPKSLTIPVRDSQGFGKRNCTQRYKIEIVARECKRRGATRDDPAQVAICFSVDELERAKPGLDEKLPWTVKVHPLLDLGISRRDCQRIVVDAGLPPAPKSSCWFCPFQKQQQWQERRRHDPDLFAKACDLDAMLRDRNLRLRGKPAGLASPTLPLDQAVADQLVLDGMDGFCDTGGCMT